MKHAKRIVAAVLILLAVMLCTGIALADGTGIVIGNHGYPWGSNMASGGITFTVDISAGSPASYRWESATSADGPWTTYTGGDLSAGATSVVTTFTPSTNTWYRCVLINADGEIATTPVMAMIKEGRWYLSNDQMAYSIISGTQYDVIGKYNGSWVNRTAYDGYWNFYSSASATPDRITVPGTGPTSTASLDYVKCYFDEENIFQVWFDAKLASDQQAFAISCDVMIRSNDNAPTTAVRNTMGTVQQLQLVDTYGALEDAKKTDASLVVYLQKQTPSCYYVGHWAPRYVYAYNKKADDNYVNYCKFDQNGTAYEVQGTDSGISVSWMNLSAGSVVKFGYGLGKVEETGASLSATITVDSESISMEADGGVYVSIYLLNDDDTRTPVKLKKVEGTDGEYYVSEDGEVEVQVSENGKLLITGLEENTDYVIRLRDGEDVSEEVVKTYVDPFTPDDDETPVPEIINITCTSALATKLSSEYTYNVLDSDGVLVYDEYMAPNSDGTLKLEGLDPYTEYSLVGEKDGNRGSEKLPFTTNILVQFDDSLGNIFAKQELPADGSGKATKPSGTPTFPKEYADYEGIPVEWISFTGWYEDSSWKTPWDFTQNVTDNTTIYAGWTLIPAFTEDPTAVDDILYDGEAHQLLATHGEAPYSVILYSLDPADLEPAAFDDIEYYYFNDGSAVYTTFDQLKGTEVGTYTVYYRLYCPEMGDYWGPIKTLTVNIYKEVPHTGDSFRAEWLIGLLALSLLGMAVLKRKGAKH